MTGIDLWRRARPLRVLAGAGVLCVLFLTGLLSRAAAAKDGPGSPVQLAKAAGESDAAFVARTFRLGPGEANIVSTDWNGVRTLFVDFERGDDTDSPERPLFALLQQPGGAFRKVFVTLGETEGGSPNVAAIGFTNADRDPARELIVVLSWSEPHAGACAPVDEVRIFDDAKPGETALRQLPIGKHFGVGCADKAKDFRYATVSAVKAELKRLGY